jgi:hypothetical protein
MGSPPCVRLKTIQVNCTLSCLTKLTGEKMRCMCGWIALFAVLDLCFICKVWLSSSGFEGTAIFSIRAGLARSKVSTCSLTSELG